MTSTLYLNATAYPLPQGSALSLYAAVWPKSAFFNPPVGQTVPPGTPTGSCFCAPTGSIAGLDNTTTYYLMVQNPQGYQHWFTVNWTTGNSSGAPMVVSVPLWEQIMNFLSLYSGPLVQWVNDV